MPLTIQVERFKCWDFNPQIVLGENLRIHLLVSKLWNKVNHWFHSIRAQCFIIINMNITNAKTVKDEVRMEFAVQELKGSHRLCQNCLAANGVSGATGLSVADNSLPKQFVKHVEHRSWMACVHIVRLETYMDPPWRKPTTCGKWSVCLSILPFWRPPPPPPHTLKSRSLY